jgi:hypothetical protein
MTMARTTAERDSDRWYRNPVLILFGLVLIVLIVSIVLLVVLTRARAALAGTAPAVTEPPAASSLTRLAALSEPEFRGTITGWEDPAPQVPWTMMLLPQEGSEGEEYVISGTMEAPDGLSGDEQVTMLIYYTENPQEPPEWLDETGMVRPPEGMRVASEIRYFVSEPGGSEWGVQIDLVPGGTHDPLGAADEITSPTDDSLARTVKPAELMLPAAAEGSDDSEAGPAEKMTLGL